VLRFDADRQVADRQVANHQVADFYNVDPPLGLLFSVIITENNILAGFPCLIYLVLAPPDSPQQE
jgi:hypothetical protein